MNEFGTASGDLCCVRQFHNCDYKVYICSGEHGTCELPAVADNKGNMRGLFVIICKRMDLKILVEYVSTVIWVVLVLCVL